MLSLPSLPSGLLLSAGSSHVTRLIVRAALRRYTPRHVIRVYIYTVYTVRAASGVHRRRHLLRLLRLLLPGRLLRAV